jgi:hypothetical protein
MAHPAIRAPAARRLRHRSLPPPDGIPTNVMPGDTGGALPAPPHGAATSYRRAAGLAAPAVSQLPP